MTPLVSGLLVGLASVLGVLIGAGFVLVLAGWRRVVLTLLLSFAAGTLLATALLGLIPEAGGYLSLTSVGWLILLAIFVFLLLEKWSLWRHAHHLTGRPHPQHASLDGDNSSEAEELGPEHVLRRRATGDLILVGDSVHNLVDGLMLGVAFQSDPTLGFMAAAAVLSHEIPQEVGDFVLLLESGLSHGRALGYNLLSALTVFPGVVLGYSLVERVAPLTGIALSFAAGAFLYVALADLIPGMHREGQGWKETTRLQLVPLVAGIAVIWLVSQFE
jgi:zinc and cadmium transporter